MSINIPPGPCPSCGKSLAMGQSTCFGCGYDRMLERNINEKPERGPLWLRLINAPIGFMLLTGGLAWLIAFLIYGDPSLTRAYFVVGTCIVLVTIVLIIKAIQSDPPGFWQVCYDRARDWYTFDILFGDRGAVGMQSLVVLSCVIVGCGVWLETGLPEAERIIAPALGIENPE